MASIAPEADYTRIESLRSRIGESLPVTELRADPRGVDFFEVGAEDGRHPRVRIYVVTGVEFGVSVEGFHWGFGLTKWDRPDNLDLAHRLVLALARRGWEESTGTTRFGRQFTDRFVTLDDGRRLVYRTHRGWGDRQFIA